MHRQTIGYSPNPHEVGGSRALTSALAGLALCMLLSSLGTSIASVALPTLARAFDASFAQVQWIVLAYLLAITSLIVGIGRLGDVLGRRRLLMAGIAVFTAASIACGFAPGLWALIVARAAQGVGAAVMMTLTLATVRDVVPKDRTGSAMGLLGTMSAAGTALGPSLGGLLIAHWDWRAIFFVNVPLGIVALLIAHRYLPADRSATPAPASRFDVLGTLLLALTVAAYALAMTARGGRFGVINALLLGAAATGAACFAIVQTRSASPLLPLRMLARPMLGIGLANAALVSAVLMATLVVGPFYLSRTLGLDPIGVGIVLSLGPIVATLTGVPAGRAVDRFGAQRAAIVGLGGIAFASALIAIVPTAFRVAGYAIPLTLLTASYALFQAANNTSVMQDVQPDERGLVSGMLNLARNLGLITGASGMGALFAVASSAAEIASADPAAIARGMRATFVIAAIATFIALVIFGWRSGRPRHAPASQAK